MDIFIAVMALIAGLGVFMFGLQVMSSGLESSAGKSMQKLFAKISNNRFMGVGVGATATAIIQSSSATSVMVVGFVNAGLMTLNQATGILMGANIGTTMTAILVSLKELPINSIFMALSAVGVFMAMFTKKDKVKRIGSILTGIGLIFIGLDIMGDSLKANDGIQEFFKSMFGSISFPLLLILVGILATAVLQSSSVVTSLVISLVALPGNVLPMYSALFLVLGSNIGTCVSALIASVGASINAKRTAFINILFNVFGVVLFTPIVWIFGDRIIVFLENMSGAQHALTIALFHVIFNVSTMLILIGFVKHIVKLSQKVVREKPVDFVADKLYFLDKRLFKIPNIAVAQMMKEVSNMAHLAERNFDLSIQNLLNVSVDNSEEIAKRERELNYLNKAITNYLVKISSLNITAANEKLIGSLYHVVSDLERIGDHAENFDEIAQQMMKDGATFSADAKHELMGMYKKIKILFKDTMYTFESRSPDLFSRVGKTEDAIDEMQRILGAHHIDRLKEGKCTVESGTYFYSCTTNFERVADHLTNIAYSIRPRTMTAEA